MNYVIGYHPSHGRWDGHFQRIKVSVNRPGVNVRHRGGYLALADEAAQASDRQASLMQAARSPLDATGVRLVVATRPDTPAPGRLALRMLIEVNDIALTEKGGHWVGKVDLAYVQQPTPDGKGATLVKDELDIRLTPEAYAKALELGLIVQKDLSLASSAYRLKVVVRDVNSGATGSVEILRGK